VARLIVANDVRHELASGPSASDFRAVALVLCRMNALSRLDIVIRLVIDMGEPWFVRMVVVHVEAEFELFHPQ
jgi:hypothetical protein